MMVLPRIRGSGRSFVVEILMAMAVVGWNPDGVDLVHRTTFPASGNFAHSWLQPHSGVGSSWRTSATYITVVVVRLNNDRIGHGPLSRGLQRLAVENIDTFQLTQQFQSCQTSGLLQFGRNGAFLGTWTDQRLGTIDLTQVLSSLVAGNGLGRLLPDTSGQGECPGGWSDNSSCLT